VRLYILFNNIYKMSNNDNKNGDKKEKGHNENDVVKVWLDSEVQLLKKWGEVADSYRLLHDRAFREFQIKSYGLTIPVIILSTLSGTASFSISSFPAGLQSYVPMIVGGINIAVGIIQTVTQFLRVNELTESHRVASISYGKFCRNITTELSLPPNNRSYNGIDFIQMCRTEIDRLIEQSPIIPMNLLNIFDKTIAFSGVTKPDVLTVSVINEYKPSKEEKVVEMMAHVAEKINHIHKNEKTMVQKIQDKINNKIGFGKKEDDVIPDEVKMAMFQNLDDIEANYDKLNSPSYDELTNKLVNSHSGGELTNRHNNELPNSHNNELNNKIINHRNNELKNIGSNGTVSKILEKQKLGLSNDGVPNIIKNAKPGLDLKKLSEIAKK